MVKKSLKKIISHANIIIYKDFNSYHLWWNSAVTEAAAKKVIPLVNWL